MALLDKPINFALDKVRKNMLNPKLADIGVIEELSFRDKKLIIRVRLDGLEDHPIEVVASDIKISPDGKTVTVENFKANKKFAQTLLDNFAAGKPFDLPPNLPPMLVTGVKKILGL